MPLLESRHARYFASEMLLAVREGEVKRIRKMGDSLASVDFTPKEYEYVVADGEVGFFDAVRVKMAYRMALAHFLREKSAPLLETSASEAAVDAVEARLPEPLGKIADLIDREVEGLDGKLPEGWRTR